MNSPNDASSRPLDTSRYLLSQWYLPWLNASAAVPQTMLKHSLSLSMQWWQWQASCWRMAGALTTSTLAKTATVATTAVSVPKRVEMPVEKRLAVSEPSREEATVDEESVLESANNVVAITQAKAEEIVIETAEAIDTVMSEGEALALETVEAMTSVRDEVVDEALTVAEEITSAEPAEDDRIDDLTAINGIGPVLEQHLNEAGIFRFEQIAAWRSKDIDALEETLLTGRFSGRARRDDWVGQAKKLASES